MSLTVLLLVLACLLAVCCSSAAKTKDAVRTEDRPMVIVSQTWSAQIFLVNTEVNVTLTAYNAGVTEARDIRISFPAEFGSPSVTVGSLPPGDRVTKTLTVKVNEPRVLDAKDAAARVEYHAKGSSLEFVGSAMPEGSIRFATAEEYSVVTSTFQSSANWLLFFAAYFGTAVALPAYKLKELEAKTKLE